MFSYFIYSFSNEDQSQKDNLDDNGPRSSCRSVLIGYTILSSVMVCYLVTILSVQMTTQKTGVMELNTLRYSTQAMIVFIVCIVNGHSLKLQIIVLPYVMIIVVSEIVYCTCFFFAAAFMPAGNIEGAYTAGFLAFTTFYDLLLLKSISRLSVSSVVVSCVGLLLLVQPWKETSREIKPIAPCDYFDGNIIYSSNTTQLANKYNNSSSITETYNRGDNITMDTLDYGNHKENPSLITLNEYIGYTLAIFGAICSGVAIYAYKRAMLSVSMEPLLFCAFLTESFVSLLLATAWNTFYGYGLELPSGIFCLLFTLLFTTASGLGCVLSFYAYRLIAVSALALAWPLVTVMLYVCQRTFLLKYHPGQSNSTEVVGIIFIALGAIGSAVINILYQTKILKF